jgi:hypothetical protein
MAFQAFPQKPPGGSWSKCIRSIISRVTFLPIRPAERVDPAGDQAPFTQVSGGKGWVIMRGPAHSDRPTTCNQCTDRRKPDPDSLPPEQPEQLPTRLSWSAERDSLFLAPVLEDDLIDDLPAENAPPPRELFAGTVELLKDHCPTASMTLHGILLYA